MAARMTMSKEQRVSEAVRFLNNIHGGRQVRLAHAELLNRGKSNQSFTDGKTRFRAWGMGLENWLHRRMEKADQGAEIFYAPTPMKGDTGRKKFQVLPTRVAFSDADYGLSPEVKARLVELGACLVRSGGHVDNDRRRPKYHVYIKLSRDVGLDELEKINRGLKVFINGDKFDATSLLRIPGTRNHKYQGSPMVRLERLADQTHRPEDMLTWFPVPKDHISGVELEGMKLPVIPEGFDPAAKRPGYAKMRFVVKHWNQRWENGNVPHRFAAAASIVKEAISKNLSVDEAYAFAMGCEPLLDKQADEGTYSIRDDVAKTYYRETKGQSSGLTVEEIKEEAGPDSKAPKEKSAPPSPPSTTPALADDEIGEVVPPKALQSKDPNAPNPYSSRDSRNYLDMAIFTSGDFKPLEPSYFNVDGAFCLLYPGMTHCIFGDSGSGKTWIVLAQIAEELKAGRKVKYIDFENGAMTIGNRLRNTLGVSAELLTPDHFKYMWFNDKPEASEIDEEAEEGYDLVIIDGVDASLALWGTDPNKATEIRAWYNEFPQRFADEGATVLSIDHTTKRASKETPPKDQQPGGAGTKLAVLTGAAFYVHPKDGYELIPGRRGIVEAYTTRKDKDGFLKSRAQKNGHLFNFIIDTVDGQTVVGFETVRQDIPTADNPQPGLTEREEEILQFLIDAGKPISPTALRNLAKGNTQDTTAIIEDLVTRGIINQDKAPRGTVLSPALSAPQREPGKKDIDFSRADVPNRYKPTRECRKCGDHHTYPDDFAQADDIGYNPKRPMCKPCAEENIESESYIPRDGAEWARKLRGRINRTRRTRGES